MAKMILFVKMGFTILTFFLLMILMRGLGNDIWVLNSPISPKMADMKSLELLWTNLVTVTLLQAFMFYVALLGTNLLFKSATKNLSKEGRA